MTAEKAIELLKVGKVIAFPTETLYGLGADPKNESAIQKIFQIKQRDQGKPIGLILSSSDQLTDWVSEIPPIAKDLMQKYWPGALTLIFKSRSDVSLLLTAGTGKIGVRVSPHPMAQKLAQEIGGAITATSANLSGNESLSKIKDVEKEVGSLVDHIIDRGDLPESLGSTIIDISENKIKILREGDIQF